MTKTHIESTAGEYCLRVNPKFKYCILNAPGGETFNLCYQCGECTAICPIAHFTRDFRPNKLIHMAKIGIREILRKDPIWLCATCYACTEICPQGVKVTDVLRVIKNLAAEEGVFPDFYQTLTTNILQVGWANTISAFTLRKRGVKGLPPLPKTKLDDIKTLAEASGLTTITK